MVVCPQRMNGIALCTIGLPAPASITRFIPLLNFSQNVLSNAFYMRAIVLWILASREPKCIQALLHVYFNGKTEPGAQCVLLAACRKGNIGTDQQENRYHRYVDYTNGVSRHSGVSSWRKMWACGRIACTHSGRISVDIFILSLSTAESSALLLECGGGGGCGCHFYSAHCPSLFVPCTWVSSSRQSSVSRNPESLIAQNPLFCFYRSWWCQWPVRLKIATEKLISDLISCCIHFSIGVLEFASTWKQCSSRDGIEHRRGSYIYIVMTVLTGTGNRPEKRVSVDRLWANSKSGMLRLTAAQSIVKIMASRCELNACFDFICFW